MEGYDVQVIGAILATGTLLAWQCGHPIVGTTIYLFFARFATSCTTDSCDRRQALCSEEQFLPNPRAAARWVEQEVGYSRRVVA